MACRGEMVVIVVKEVIVWRCLRNGCEVKPQWRREWKMSISFLWLTTIEKDKLTLSDKKPRSWWVRRNTLNHTLTPQTTKCNRKVIKRYQDQRPLHYIIISLLLSLFPRFSRKRDGWGLALLEGVILRSLYSIISPEMNYRHGTATAAAASTTQLEADDDRCVTNPLRCVSPGIFTTRDLKNN